MQPSNLSRWLGEALGEAGAISAPRLPGDDLLIVYTPGAEPPAHQLYLAYLHAGRRALLAGAAEAALHVLPYREDAPAVVVFTDGGKSALTVVAAEQAAMLGAETYIVGPELHPVYEEKLGMLGVERVTVKGRHPVMAATLAALEWAPRPLGARAARLRRELDSLPSAAEWVVERFREQIEAIAGEQPGAVYYTPAMAPAAFYLARLAGEAGGSRPCVEPLQYLDEARRGVPAVAMYTELERHALREKVMAARVRGVKFVEVAVNTDPLTAGIYGMLLSAAAYQRMP
ncbi:hypothetical protein [Stetteria hydrogenophila]